jgi:flavin-dependent dehydrogenase
MSPSAAPYDCDVIIAGGGPAGSTLATLLTQAGLRAVLLEAEHFPRQHVGESLVPAVMPVLRETGVLPAIEAARFSLKYGACWTTPSLFRGTDANGRGGKRSFRSVTTRFAERVTPNAGMDFTYHVDRARFDTILLQHAAKEGAIVLEGMRAHDPVFDDDGVTVTARAGGAGGLSWPLRAKMFVDATGRSTLLGSRLKLKVHDPVFDQYAVYTWFEGFDRGALTPTREESEYIAIHFVPDHNTWIWQIPISDTLTSIGVVAQKTALRAHGGSREEFFWDTIKLRPELELELRAARVADSFHTEGEYSYGMRQICGDRWVLIGDAARFVDPIFSSGVSIALNSARFAARDIVAAFGADDFGKASFGTFETTMRRGMRNWYEFISLYYRLNVLFTALARDKRYRYDLVKMLQGDLYDDDAPPCLVHMREVVTEVENNPNHLWHRYLGTMRAPAAEPAF